MLSIQEKKKSAKHLLCTHDGVVAVWFLLLFLFCTAAVFAGIMAKRHYLEAMVFMKKANTYQCTESIILDHVKCALLKDELVDGILNVPYVDASVTLYDDALTIDISSPVEETITVFFDAETHYVYEMDVMRHEDGFY